MINQKYLNIWLAFATDRFGYSEEEAREMYVGYEGNFKKFLTPAEIESMFEWSSLPVPKEL